MIAAALAIAAVGAASSRPQREHAMDDMRRIAYETVLRACGFGSLAIFCVMIGLSFEPRVAFQAGGMLTM